MKDIGSRFGLSSLGVVLVASGLLGALHPIWGWLFVGLTAALGSLAFWEYLSLAREKGVVVSKWFTVVCFVLIWVIGRWGGHGALLALGLIWFIANAGLFRRRQGAVLGLAVLMFGMTYIALPMGLIIKILHLPSQDGRWWVAYLISVTKMGDITAYFGGQLWGRRKLAPLISPGKTVEGAVFGLLGGLGASFLFHLMSVDVGESIFALGNVQWIVLGVVLGVLGQFGDLAESLLKRDAHRKDSNCIPGLGGGLDLIDSLLPNACFLYLYLHQT
jgi:phosphatidate cytidylyltransferase